MSNQQSAATRFGGVTPKSSLSIVVPNHHYVVASFALAMFPRVSSTTRAYLASTTTGEVGMVSPQSRAIAAICFELNLRFSIAIS